MSSSSKQGARTLALGAVAITVVVWGLSSVVAKLVSTSGLAATDAP
jgi:hypothetical protein